MKLPNKITILGAPITITEKAFKGTLHEGKKGYWQDGKGQIVLEKNQPKVGKIITLIHEAMHVVETMLLQNGAIKKRINHEFIGGAAFGLAAILIGAGAIKGITNKDLIRLVETCGDEL